MFTTMLAIALLFGSATDGEIWSLDDVPETNWSPVVVEVEVPEACVTVFIDRSPEGWITSSYTNRVYTGGLTSGDVQATVVGHFLNIGLGQSGDYWEMELTSIDVTGLDEVKICR